MVMHALNHWQTDLCEFQASQGYNEAMGQKGKTNKQTNKLFFKKASWSQYL